MTVKNSPAPSIATASTAWDRDNHHHGDGTFEEVPMENRFAGNLTNSDADPNHRTVSTIENDAATTAKTSNRRFLRPKRIAIFVLLLLIVAGLWTVVALAIFTTVLKDDDSGSGGADDGTDSA